MSRLSDSVNAAKLALSDQKATSTYSVNQAKQAILNPVTNSSLAENYLEQNTAIGTPPTELAQDTNVRVRPALPSSIQQSIFDAEKSFKLRHPDPRRVVNRKGNVLFRADGSLSIITHDGEILDNVAKDQIPQILALEEQKYLDKKPRAEIRGDPSDSSVVGLVEQGVELGGKLTRGALSAGSWLSGIGTPSSTLNEEVSKYKREAGGDVGVLNYLKTDKPISDDDVKTYNIFKDRLRSGVTPTDEDIAYFDSESYKLLSSLEIGLSVFR